MIKKSILGKIIGGLFGLMLLGPLGIILGVFLGHLLDQQFNFASPHKSHISQIFFESLFRCMGYLAKADGRVSESEIQMARLIMQQMRLSEKDMYRAMAFFTEGKQPGFNLNSQLAKLTTAFESYNAPYRKQLSEVFIQLQFQSAYADGKLDSTEKNILDEMARQLSISQATMQRFHGMFNWNYSSGHSNSYSNSNNYSSSSSYSNTFSSENNLNQAYKVLGVSKSSTLPEIKRAYRKLMNQYHPDKLISQGVPESVIKAATEKTRAIKEAYDLIKRARG